MKPPALATLAALLVLTACGAAGPPERPETAESAVLDRSPGINVSGTAEIGVGGMF